jgi:hypothetical protein
MNSVKIIIINIKHDVDSKIEPSTRLRVGGGIVTPIYPLGPLHLSGPSGMFSTFLSLEIQ